ncbi:unnamed protein product [Linum tenue]|uniref:Glycosyltransferase N-terminal domain-containing protein n=1 Tax=Linum tenue TaxID=586396 RepID=A0AAV0NLP4_9ROSI|nr:unnamed protein product [Linum tenue]
MAANNEQASTPCSSQPHCIVIPFPAQGHINPMLQFSKRLIPRGVRVTLVNTRFISKTVANSSSSAASSCSTTIHLATISDGFDEGGRAAAESSDAYLSSFQTAGSQTLSQLITDLGETECPATCIIYDPFIPWCLGRRETVRADGGGYQGKTEVFHHCSCNSNLQRSTMERRRLQEGRRRSKATPFHHQQS